MLAQYKKIQMILPQLKQLINIKIKAIRNKMYLIQAKKQTAFKILISIKVNF